jgi:glucose/mannose-6-phosphate isomerase
MEYMLPQDIKNYAAQFAYQPVVENASKLKKKFSKFIVVGMGGSHLAADILKAWHPELNLTVWSDYGVPKLHEKVLKENLTIVSSYSGNTEEALDAFAVAHAKHYPMAVIASGGKLLRLAEKAGVPYVKMPHEDMQPRMALGFSLMAMLAVIGEKAWIQEARELMKQLHPAREERRGEDLAKRLYGSIPIIYVSARNAAIGYNWKIKFNETGKIPAFTNVVPELNHNEMTGFDAKEKTLSLSRGFRFVFLKDGSDDRRVLKRMSVLERLLHDRGFKVEIVLLQGKTEVQKIFNALVLADWTAYHTAKLYGVDPEHVPMVEEFKKLIVKGDAH